MLTVESCSDIATILTSKDIDYLAFAEKYDGKYVEIDGYVITHSTYDGGTSHIIEVVGGDYIDGSEVGYLGDYDGLIIRIGNRTHGNMINEFVEVGDNVKIKGRVDLSWSEFHKNLYIETRYLDWR